MNSYLILLLLSRFNYVYTHKINEKNAVQMGWAGEYLARKKALKVGLLLQSLYYRCSFQLHLYSLLQKKENRKKSVEEELK